MTRYSRFSDDAHQSELAYLNRGAGVMSSIMYRNPKDMVDKLFLGKLGYSPKVQEILDKVGKDGIIALQIWRNPVGSMLTSALNVVSMGEFNKRFKNSDYDKLFHLGVVAKTHKGLNVLIEKNEIINMDYKPKKKPKTEVYSIHNVPNGLTIYDFVNGGRNVLGDNKFFKYSAKDSNCQDFVLSLFKGSKILTPPIQEFVKQDVSDIFEGLTGLRKISNATTDLGAKFDVLMQGGSAKSGYVLKQLKEGKLDISKMSDPSDDFVARYGNKRSGLRWIDFVKQYAQANGLTYKQALVSASGEYHKQK